MQSLNKKIITKRIEHKSWCHVYDDTYEIANFKCNCITKEADITKVIEKEV